MSKFEYSFQVRHRADRGNGEMWRYVGAGRAVHGGPQAARGFPDYLTARRGAEEYLMSAPTREDVMVRLVRRPVGGVEVVPWT